MRASTPTPTRPAASASDVRAEAEGSWRIRAAATGWAWRIAAAVAGILGAPFALLFAWSVLIDEASGGDPQRQLLGSPVAFFMAAGLWSAAGWCWRRGSGR